MRHGRLTGRSAACTLDSTVPTRVRGHRHRFDPPQGGDGDAAGAVVSPRGTELIAPFARRDAPSAGAHGASGEGAPRTLTLLGQFSLTCNGTELPLSAAAQRILALVAIEPRSARRSVIAGTLWPEMTQHRALANVRRALWRLPEPDGRPLLTESRSGLSLAAELLVDVHRRRDIVSALERGQSCAQSDVEDLCSELLPDWPDIWIECERERCRQDGLHGLDAAAATAAERRQFAYATRIGLMAIELDPLRESSHRGLMLVHLLEGNLVDARRRYDLYLRLLVEAGLEPVVSEQTLALVKRALPSSA